MIVFDDAVVNERDLLCIVRMRVRVDVGRLAMRGPARVANAAPAGNGVLFQQRFQIRQMTLRLCKPDLRSVVDRNAG